MSGARFLFLMRGGFDATVIDSQVVDSIASVASHGIRFDLVAFMPGATWFSQREFQRARRAEIARRIGGRVRAYLSVRQGLPSGNALAEAELLFELARHPARRTVIHARGDGPSVYANRVSKLWPGVRYVYDVRGDSEAEFRLHPDIEGISPEKSEAMVQRIRYEQALAVEGASHLLCVSSVLRDRLIERHRIAPERVTVVPCLADETKFRVDETERAATRRELGLEARFVIVYPGRFHLWHDGPRMVSLVQALMKAQPDLYFLVLTPDDAHARSLCESQLPPGSFDVRSAKHAEVPRYLRAGDLGLLLRERHPLNEAACPTKFAEYVMTGLPVLISEGIGDCSPFIAEQDAGIVVGADDPKQTAAALARLRQEPADHRHARIAAAATRFSRQRAAARMAEIYHRLAAP